MPKNSTDVPKKQTTSNCKKTHRDWHPIIFFSLFLLPYALLLVLSLGNGWTYPRLLPDHIELTSWQNFFSDRNQSYQALGSSILLSISVATLSTTLGVLVGFYLPRRTSLWNYIIFLPFVVSPVIVGICLLDLAIRTGLASTFFGVITGQLFFAFAFASIFFSELWDKEIDRRITLIESLGGNSTHIFTHAVVPRIGPLIVICWMQTAMFSWLDYGIISVIGGGIVRSMTLNLFSYLREGSVNHAAQAGIVLMSPPVLAMLFASWILRHHDGRASSHD